MAENEAGAWTPERIAEARALCDGATPGPWEVRVMDYPRQTVIYGNRENPLVAIVSTGEGWPPTGNTAFILGARTLLPSALDEIERLADKVSAMRLTIYDLERQVRDAKRDAGDNWHLYQEALRNAEWSR